MPIGRVRRSADFERVLATPGRARSAHFVVHHLPQAASPRVEGSELSTGMTLLDMSVVDDTPLSLGLVVPKRHARRAATRSLLKRQIRAGFERHAAGLAAGLWVVRLRAPFDRGVFSSAQSQALRDAVCAELDGLLSRLGRPPRGRDA